MAMSQSPAALSAKGDELRLDVESSYVLVPASAGDDGSAVDTQHYQQDDQLENIPRDDGDDDVASSCCPSYVASDDEDYDDADLPGAMPWWTQSQPELVPSVYPVANVRNDYHTNAQRFAAKKRARSALKAPMPLKRSNSTPNMFLVQTASTTTSDSELSEATVAPGLDGRNDAADAESLDSASEHEFLFANALANARARALAQDGDLAQNGELAQDRNLAHGRDPSQDRDLAHGRDDAAGDEILASSSSSRWPFATNVTSCTYYYDDIPPFVDSKERCRAHTPPNSEVHFPTDPEYVSEEVLQTYRDSCQRTDNGPDSYLPRKDEPDSGSSKPPVDPNKKSSQKDTDAQEGIDAQGSTDALEETYVHEETDAHEETHVQEETDAHEETHVQEETDVQEEPHVQEETHAYEETHIYKEADVQEEADAHQDIDAQENAEVQKEVDVQDKANVRGETHTHEETDTYEEINSSSEIDVQGKADAHEKADVQEETHAQEGIEAQENIHNQEQSRTSEYVHTQDDTHTHKGLHSQEHIHGQEDTRSQEQVYSRDKVDTQEDTHSQEQAQTQEQAHTREDHHAQEDTNSQEQAYIHENIHAQEDSQSQEQIHTQEQNFPKDNCGSEDPARLNLALSVKDTGQGTVNKAGRTYKEWINDFTFPSIKLEHFKFPSLDNKAPDHDIYSDDEPLRQSHRRLQDLTAVDDHDKNRTSVAYITLVTDASYLPGVVALNHSIRKYGGKKSFIVLYTSNLSRDALIALQAIEQQNCSGNKMKLYHIQPLLPPDKHEIKLADARFADTWTKLKVFEPLVFDRYHTMLYLDADMLVTCGTNIDDIFEYAKDLPKYCIAAVHDCKCGIINPPGLHTLNCKENCVLSLQDPSSGSKATIIAGPGGRKGPISMGPVSSFNSGLFLFHPSWMLWESINEYFYASSKLGEYSFPDQDFLVTFFQGRFASIPWGWNAVKTMAYRHEGLWAPDQVKIVHYIVDKPWAKATHRGDKEVGFSGKDGPLHAAWWEAFEEWKEEMERRGLSGLVLLVGGHCGDRDGKRRF